MEIVLTVVVVSLVTAAVYVAGLSAGVRRAERAIAGLLDEAHREGLSAALEAGGFELKGRVTKIGG